MEDEEYFQKTVARVVATREAAKKELTRLGFTFRFQNEFYFLQHIKIYQEKKFSKHYVNMTFMLRHWNKPRIADSLRISIGTDEEMHQMIAFLEDYLERRGN